MANIIANQRRVLETLLGELRPHWRSDRALPVRIDRLIKSDRRLGSRDRRLYRELIYTALRYLSWVEPWLEPAGPAAPFFHQALAWLAADLPATHAYRSRTLAESAQAWPPCPSRVAAKAQVLANAAAAAGAASGAPLPSLLPPWAAEECPLTLEPAETDALHRRAPLWIRLQGATGADDEKTLAEFTGREWPWRRSELLDTAVRIDAEADLTRTEAYRQGCFEIQDLGSQLILAAAAPAAGGRWLDACAGAGGKSLQLAVLLGAEGSVDVHDVRPGALAELEMRTARAGLSERIHRLADGRRPAASYDGVLVDVPCTGSGTWRRAPHLKAVTNSEAIASAAELQLSLLAQFSYHVRPGGRLVYATCSLCPRENEALIERFLAAQADPPFFPSDPPRSFSGRPAGPGGLLFAPSVHDGDGFFVASLRRGA